MKGLRFMTAALVLLTGACAHQAVQDMGHGQHSLTAVSDSGGYSGSHEAAVEEANAYCSRQRQQAVVDGFYDRAALGPDGTHASSLIFRCAPPTHLSF